MSGEITLRRENGDILVEDERGEHIATFHGHSGLKGLDALVSGYAAMEGYSVFDETEARYLLNCGTIEPA